MPSAKIIVSFISLRPRLTIFVPVLAISAGNDTKLPIGNFLNDLLQSQIHNHSLVYYFLQYLLLLL